MNNSNPDIFNRKPKDLKPKNISNDDYLQNKTFENSKNLKERVLNPSTVLKAGQNVRLNKETHALLKVIALQENREMYTIFNKSLTMYLDSLSKDEQKQIWKKMEQMIDLGLIKI